MRGGGLRPPLPRSIGRPGEALPPNQGVPEALTHQYHNCHRVFFRRLQLPPGLCWSGCPAIQPDAKKTSCSPFPALQTIPPPGLIADNGPHSSCLPYQSLTSADNNFLPRCCIAFQVSSPRTEAEALPGHERFSFFLFITTAEGFASL